MTKSSIYIWLGVFFFAPSVAFSSVNDDRLNQSITYYCSKANVNSKQTVSVGQGKMVSMVHGSFYQYQTDSNYQATIELIADELANMGISPDCAEYLMTHSRLQGYEQGNVMARVYFDFDKYNLTDESKYILDVVTNVVKQNSSELLLEGHTDNSGSKGYNFALGLKRSEAVQDYLLSRGADGDNFLMVSKGEGEPIANNKTAEGRAKNRRVDIVDEQPLN
jgi:outer membrane protein OmpA-like peptidoglycan-associated protein